MIGLTAGFCVLTMYRITRDYMDHDIITVTKVVEEGKALFPAFTLCAKVASTNTENFSRNQVDICLFEETQVNVTAEIEQFSIQDGTYMCLRYNGYHRFPGINANKDIQQTTEFGTITDVNSEGFVVRVDVDLADFKFCFQDNYLNTYDKATWYTIKKSENLKVYVTRSVDKQLGEPHSRCDQNSDVAYRQSNCIEQCVNKRIADEYNCTIFTDYYSVENLPQCDDQRVSLKYNMDQMFPCRSQCSKECHATTWKAVVLPGSVSEANEGKTRLRVNLDEMSHVETSQQAKETIWSLLAAIGGTLGFLGMSALTFVEIFEAVLELMKICLCSVKISC